MDGPALRPGGPRPTQAKERLTPTDCYPSTQFPKLSTKAGNKDSQVKSCFDEDNKLTVCKPTVLSNKHGYSQHAAGGLVGTLINGMRTIRRNNFTPIREEFLLKRRQNLRPGPKARGQKRGKGSSGKKRVRSQLARASTWE